MVGHGSKFDRKKEEAIAALLTQRSIAEAAKVAGIGTQTLHRWLKIPEFQAEYQEARRAAVSQANARLQQAASEAVSTLLAITADVNAPASARVRASDLILRHAKQGIQTEDLEARLATLEQMAEGARGGKALKGTNGSHRLHALEQLPQFQSPSDLFDQISTRAFDRLSNKDVCLVKTGAQKLAAEPPGELSEAELAAGRRLMEAVEAAAFRMGFRVELYPRLRALEELPHVQPPPSPLEQIRSLALQLLSDQDLKALHAIVRKEAEAREEPELSEAEETTSAKWSSALDEAARQLGFGSFAEAPWKEIEKECAS